MPIKANNDRPKSNKATGRDYTYDKAYNKDPEHRKRHAARNAARRLAEAKYGKKAIQGKDIDHKKPLAKGGGTGASNIRVRDRHANRADKD